MRIVKFSDCVDYMIKGPFGSDMKKSLYVPKGDNTYKVYIQVNAIQKDQTLGEYYVSEEYFHKKLERFEVHPGDYLITCDGTLGKFIKLDKNIEKGVISSSLLLLKLKEDVMYDKYFELIWEYSMLGYLASQARNACLVHLPSAKAIGDVEIVLPDLKEQIELADRAFSVSNIIEKRKSELALFDNLIKARFVEMFGDPEVNSMDWPEVIIGDNCFVTKLAGFEYTKYINYEDTGDVVMVKAQNVKNGVLNEKDLSYISNEVSDSLPRSQLAPGDVVMTYVGANIGDVAIIDDKHKYHLAPNVAKIRPDAEKYDSMFFMHMLMMKTDYIMRNSADTAKAALGMERIRKLNVFVPPIELQAQFAEFVKQVDKSKFAVQKSLDETQLIFDSLMQQYFG